MVGFYKFMVISACVLLAMLIFYAGSRAYKESTTDKVAWPVVDAYAIGLIYTAIKILGG